MKRLILAVSLPLTAASAQTAPVISTPPPIQRQMLLAWMPGEVRCSGETVAALPMRRPWTSMVWGTMSTLKPATYAFDIDASGRTVGISRVGTDYVSYSDDIGPSLAATHFAAGVPHARCSVTYTPSETRLADAPIEDLVSYSLMPLSGALPKEGWDRIRPAGSCLDEPRPQALTMVYPDFRAIRGTPGIKDWSMVVYDTSPAGRPRNVRILTGTRNQRLDAASVKAIDASRFTGGPRTGCLYPYHHAPEKLLAPEMPAEDEFRPANATCPRPHEWAVKPTLSFPEAYRRRSIEGWAVVTYDLAPWGETGNIRVVASQPSEDFGKQASQLIRNARAISSTQGATGCVDRVRFVMGPTGTPPGPPQPPAPLLD